MPQTFHRLLRDYRERYGLPQKAVAATLGVSVATVARWETGHPVPAHHRHRLAAIMAGEGHHVPVDLRLMLSRDPCIASLSTAGGIALDVTRQSVLKTGGGVLSLIGTNILKDRPDNGALMAEQVLPDLVSPRGDIAQVSFLDRGILMRRTVLRRTWTRIVVDGTIFRHAIDEIVGEWDGQPLDLDLQIVTRDEIELKTKQPATTYVVRAVGV